MTGNIDDSLATFDDVPAIFTDTPARGSASELTPNQGEDNAPLVALARRTRNLYNQVNGRVDQGVKTTDSPTFDTVNCGGLSVGLVAEAAMMVADAGDFTNAGSGTVNSDVITATVSLNAPTVNATTVNSGLLAITGNTGRTKRINEGVFGSKHKNLIALAESRTLEDLSFAGGELDVVNLLTFSQNSEFNINYPGKYRVTFSAKIQTTPAIVNSCWYDLRLKKVNGATETYLYGVNDFPVGNGSYVVGHASLSIDHLIGFEIVVPLIQFDKLTIPFASNYLTYLRDASFNIKMLGN